MIRPRLRTMSQSRSLVGPTKPANELFLAQLILGAFIVGLIGHATYEKDYEMPSYIFQFTNGRPLFKRIVKDTISINEFRTSHAVLGLLVVSAAYFFVNSLLYVASKLTKEPLLYKTILILMQDVVFCVLMFACSMGAIADAGDRATGRRMTEIRIATGISLFCCVSSGVGVYYSYKVYKGL